MRITGSGCSWSGLSVVPAMVSRVGELVDRVDERDRVLGVVDRAEAERRRWPHRIATTICRDPTRRILVLRRAEQLTRFPGHYDVMVGGAVNVGESYEDAAARELSEELGADVPVRFLFTFLCRDGVGPVWFGVHEAVIIEPLVPDPSEIAWHAWLTEPDLREAVDRWPFVPGGREALRRYVTSGNEGRPSAC
jgi:8-oxo-dGTP pyrophosphatase MutT (NUDIX family)